MCIHSKIVRTKSVCNTQCVWSSYYKRNETKFIRLDHIQYNRCFSHWFTCHVQKLINGTSLWWCCHAFRYSFISSLVFFSSYFVHTGSSFLPDTPWLTLKMPIYMLFLCEHPFFIYSLWNEKQFLRNFQ